MIDELPNFSRDELEMYGIENILDEFMLDFEQSEDGDTLNSTQVKLLQKWNIDANIENLTLITKKFIDNPAKMTTQLMIMILGKNMLQNMSPNLGNKVNRMYTIIPENVQNFVLEYVNEHATSAINNSTFLSTLKQLCARIRNDNKKRTLIGDSKWTEDDLFLSQVKLLEKFHINVDAKVLNDITNKFRNHYTRMARQLLKIILGERNLQNMCIKKISKKRKLKPIPENILNFIFEYVNLYAAPKMQRGKFLTFVSNVCNQARIKNPKRDDNSLESSNASEEENDDNVTT
ncbi:uncharacterized protein LOC122499577 [Leptopilina heterotoma]|uniref:uncharacterized protein LOC122499577 n=1 Tax=Leptopilina heterotoma TaxID=63436 RepID=UPI001CA9B984|nr:uncharacterized protein LOC122499577 [Leptopilina heterotoma]